MKKKYETPGVKVIKFGMDGRIMNENGDLVDNNGGLGDWADELSSNDPVLT